MTRFAVGDRVRIAARYPAGRVHIRTPYYIRGKTGEIERICGEFRNPEKLAFGDYDAEKHTLYRVRFDQAHLWEDYDGPPDDTVEVEVYDHWLEPAE